MRVNIIAVAFAVLTIPHAVAAHDVTKGPNGGQVVDDGGRHIDFTAAAWKIVLYLSDNADVPVRSAKATAG